ncbi:hypothetical protein [Paenibacillus agaridevorans]|uniref:hypothetical protein n=1 Tax=Paenibacillus agaridevorans TaxID=171404 RepID=UPI001BE3E566|nr:hypothetical protein [Paenibacillus agaridevorans]
MSATYYDQEGQRLRSRHFNALVTEYTIHRFNDHGEWLTQEEDSQWKVAYSPSLYHRLCYAAAYLDSKLPEQIAKANVIIRTSAYERCQFSPLNALQLLVRNRTRLEPATIHHLYGYLDTVWDHFLDDGMDFVGVNDNFPCIGTAILLVGGELLQRPDLYEKGKVRLGQLKRLLQRRGVTSEFSSPTYTPLQVLAMAEIAELIQDEEMRQLALSCEERMWVEVLGRYHKETSQMAGPYSRAYTVNSDGHSHHARDILYAVLGDALPVNPLNTLFSSPNGQEGEVIHGWPFYMQALSAWQIDTQYHCPAYLVEWALNRTYPFSFIATTEFSSSTGAPPSGMERSGERKDYIDEYAAGSGVVSTYMTEDYALGVSSHEFHNGVQTDSFHLLYRKSRPALHQSAIRTVYCRYIVNDRKPDAREVLLEDEGRKIGVQHKSSAMLLYRPKLEKAEQISSLKLTLCYSGSVDEIWVGSCRVEGEGQRVEYADSLTVFVRDADVFMAYLPLLGAHDDQSFGQAAIEVDMSGAYKLVSFCNYTGPERDFGRQELLTMANGFVVEVGSVSEHGSFEAFRKLMKGALLEDRFYSNVHTRGTRIRHTSYSRPGLSLACEYSPSTEGIKYMEINGRVPVVKPLATSGLSYSSLPFMSETE